MKVSMIKRHTKSAILIHWFNAICWFFLLATGIGLIDNPWLQPLAMWWTRMMKGLFGAAENLLLAHEICGVVWAVVFSIYGIIFLKKETIPFIKEIFTFSPKNDLSWLIKKMIQMTMGYKVLTKLGFEPKIPDQGFYNTGQKFFAIPALLGGITIAITGLVMLLSKHYIASVAIVQWSILVHFVSVGLVFAGLLIHIYMAAIARGEWPAFISMFTGTIPEDFARHHNKLWYDKIA